MTNQSADGGMETVDGCPCCTHPLSPVFYDVDPVPVHSCLMLGSQAEASLFPTGSVQLALCDACGFVTNAIFDSQWSAYAPNYEDQQSFSPRFNSFAGRLAQDLVQRHGLAGKSVVEIGCSKGDFLALLAGAGMGSAVGIDPSASAARLPESSRDRIQICQEYYDKRHLKIPADLICCRHTLEHIQPVQETLAVMRQHAERNPKAVLCIEVPDATRIWKDYAFEDIYYEHCSYFTAGALAAAVRRAGFAVTDLRREYNDQYLVLEGSTDQSRDRKFEIEETANSTSQDVAHFASNVSGKIKQWTSRLSDAHEKGRRIAIWGSGSKCVAFLKTIGCAERITAIIDVNPHRNGKYAPGMPIPISSPSDLPEIDADLIVVMNSMYLEEIKLACSDAGADPEFLTLEGE